MHRVMHNTCIKHGRNIRTRIFLGRHQSCSEERIEVVSNPIERYHSSREHSRLIVFRKLLGWKLEKPYTRKYVRHLNLLPRSPWNVTGWQNWVQKLLNDPMDKLFNNLKSSQSNQPNPNPDHDDRTGQPVVGSDPMTAPGARKTSRSQEIATRSFHEEAVKHDRTGTPVVCRDASHEPGHEQSMLNEVNIDFRIRKPGLPHSVVKQAQNSRVRELVKKIENHPHRHSLQRDLQQNKAWKPVQYDDKANDSNVGVVWTVRDGP